MKLTGRTRTVLAVIDCAWSQGQSLATFNTPEDKRALRLLERRGVISIERTSERFGGLLTWKAKRAGPNMHIVPRFY